MARVTYVLSDLDQETAPRHLRQGSLTVSLNTRSTKTGPRRKRRGFARQAISTFSFPIPADDDDSSPSATMQELSPGGAMFRDANDNIWARSSDGTTAYFRGEHRRCGVTAKDSGFQQHKTIKPMSLNVGTEIWHFCLGTTETGSSPTSEPVYDSIFFTREDASGTVISGPTRLADVTGNSITNYVAVYHPANAGVWVFMVYRNTVIHSRRIPTSTGIPPSSGTVFATTANAKYNTVDAIYNTTEAKVMVVATSWNEANFGGGDVMFARQSHLNTATGAEANGVTVTSSDNIAGAYLTGGASWLQGQPFSDGKARYVYWKKNNPVQDNLELRHVTVTAATNATAADTLILTAVSTRYTLEHAGVCTGYYTAATDVSTVFSQIIFPGTADEETSNPTGVGNSFNQVVARTTFNNATLATSSQDACLGSWLASKPFQGADSKWYVLTGVDSGVDGYQRAFHVRRADIGFTRVSPDICRIVGQIFWPDASPSAHRWRGNLGASPPTITNSWGWAPTQAAITSGAKFALGRTGETPQTHAIHIVTVDFGAAFSPGVQVYDDLIVYPGSVPVVAGPRSPAHDLTPLIFPIRPPRLTAAGSSSALGAVLVTVSFRIRDPSGRITRSTSYPDPVSMVFNSAGTRTLALRSCQHIGHGVVEIELWASAPGETDICLQTVIPNVPTSSEITVAVDPANFRTDTESLPASAEGFLVQNPPPPCRVVAKFGERIFVTGTPVEGEILYSKTFEPGFGPEFNLEGLSQVWVGQGPINAAAPVDLNTLALWRPKQIGALQGPGPTDAGGPYGQVLELSSGDKGISPSSSRGHVVVKTTLGPVFQDAASGRLCIVQPGLRVDELPPGVVVSASDSRLRAGAEMASEGTVWFVDSFGVIMVVDLRHPEETAASRWGNWHRWFSSATTESDCVGVVDTANGPLWLQANGSWRTYKTTGQLFQDTNAAGAEVDVLKTLTTGLMAPDGHHGEVTVSDLQALGTHLSASLVRFTTTNDAGSAENHDVTLSSPFNYSWRPGNLLRVQEFSLTIAEQAGSTGEGFELDSIGIEFEPAGRMKRLATTRIV